MLRSEAEGSHSSVREREAVSVSRVLIFIRRYDNAFLSGSNFDLVVVPFFICLQSKCLFQSRFPGK